MTLIHKKLVPKTDFGFVRGESVPRVIHGWEIQTEPNVEFSESEHSIPDESYIAVGKYYHQSRNIFNIEDGCVETHSFHLASVITSRDRNWVFLTNEKYPLYDIRGGYIGYVEGNKTYYSFEYLWANHMWTKLFKKSDKFQLAQSIIVVGLAIYMIYHSFFA